MHHNFALSLRFGWAELEMVTSVLFGCCIARAPTRSVLFLQLGCCGKPSGESLQPQQCGELLEVAGWGWMLIPAQGIMGSSQLF